MSDLAFNANGESFETPAEATEWRVRRMKPRGAPELVYGIDGCPLTIRIGADIEELRDAVSCAGKYRLDAINDHGKCVENVPPAYVHVTKPEHTESTALAVTPTSSHNHSDDTLREAMKLNTELAKSVIDRFPDMMHAAAELLRAADGAGLPSRKPRAVDYTYDDDDDDGDEDDAVVAKAAPGGFDLNAILAQLVPVLVTGFMSGKMKLPGLASMFDWRKAQPSNDAATEATSPRETPSGSTTKPNQNPYQKPKTKAPQSETPKAKTPADVASESATATTPAIPLLDAAGMAHVVAIQSALQPHEVAYVQEVAKDLSPAEVGAWFDELSKLSVPDAVARIRGLIAGASADKTIATTGGAS